MTTHKIKILSRNQLKNWKGDVKNSVLPLLAELVDVNSLMMALKIRKTEKKMFPFPPLFEEAVPNELEGLLSWERQEQEQQQRQGRRDKGESWNPD